MSTEHELTDPLGVSDGGNALAHGDSGDGSGPIEAVPLVESKSALQAPLFSQAAPIIAPQPRVPELRPAFEIGGIRGTGEPVLISATVRFQTLNDDKHRNSVVTVTVRDATNGIIAYVDNIFDEFKDQRNYGPYDMQVMNPVVKSLVRPGGSVTLYFVQDANDEWHTNFLVDLAFSDGSHIAVEQQDLSFTGSHPKQVFGM